MLFSHLCAYLSPVSGQIMEVTHAGDDTTAGADDIADETRVGQVGADKLAIGFLVGLGIDAKLAFQACTWRGKSGKSNKKKIIHFICLIWMIHRKCVVTVV